MYIQTKEPGAVSLWAFCILLFCCGQIEGVRSRGVENLLPDFCKRKSSPSILKVSHVNPKKKDTLPGVFFVFQALLFPILCGQLVPQAVIDALLFQQLGMGTQLLD